MNDGLGIPIDMEAEKAIAKEHGVYRVIGGPYGAFAHVIDPEGNEVKDVRELKIEGSGASEFRVTLTIVDDYGVGDGVAETHEEVHPVSFALNGWGPPERPVPLGETPKWYLLTQKTFIKMQGALNVLQAVLEQSPLISWRQHTDELQQAFEEIEEA